MIGWVILAAVLVPALVLGRWAERERRRADAEARLEADGPTQPVQAAGPVRGRTRRLPLGHPGQARDAASRRSRTYAGR